MHDGKNRRVKVVQMIIICRLSCFFVISQYANANITKLYLLRSSGHQYDQLVSFSALTPLVWSYDL